MALLQEQFFAIHREHVRRKRTVEFAWRLMCFQDGAFFKNGAL